MKYQAATIHVDKYLLRRCIELRFVLRYLARWRAGEEDSW